MRFVDFTMDALTLLQPLPEFKEIIENNIDLISDHSNNRRQRHSAAEAFPDTKRVCVYAKEPIFTCQYSYSLLLAHEAFHNHIYSRFIRHSNRQLWKWHRRYFRNRDEFKCTRFEIYVCRQLGFPEEILEWKELSIMAIPHAQVPRKQIRIINNLRRLSLIFGCADTSVFKSTGPMNADSSLKNQHFWRLLSNEVIAISLLGVMVCTMTLVSSLGKYFRGFADEQCDEPKCSKTCQLMAESFARTRLSRSTYMDSFVPLIDQRLAMIVGMEHGFGCRDCCADFRWKAIG